MVGGVAGGVAAKLGLDPVVVRVAFALLSIGGGTGLALYMLAWLLIPRQGSSGSILSAVAHDPRTIVLAVAFATVFVCLLLASVALGIRFAANLLWPLAFGGAALAAVWRGADDEERAFLRSQAEGIPVLSSSGRHSVLFTIARGVIGLILVAGGLTTLSGVRRNFFGGETVVGALAVVAGFVVAFGPWWLRIARDLAVERRQRVRVEERAEMAAHLHDSVLQTLALIQRSATDAREVTRLARVQEKELRAWLFEGRVPGTFDQTRLTDAVAALELDVESRHGVPVDAVVVGDCELSEPVQALLAAGREAAVNAAKWSGAPSVSVFVEAEDTRVSMFVRDRGKGFDPDLVAEDRKGISESIRARMARFGGKVEIRSAPGDGTDVELVMPGPP